MPPTLVLPARSTRTLDVKYRPLLAGQGNAKVEATCAELGTFVFDVAVKAAAAGADRSLSFRAPLGNTDVQTFRFNHLLADKAEYKVTVDGADFIVDSAAVAAPAAGKRSLQPCVVAILLTIFFTQRRMMVLKCLWTCDSSPQALASATAGWCCRPLQLATSFAFSRAARSPPALKAPLKSRSGDAAVAAALPPTSRFLQAAGGATVNFKNVYPKATTFTVTCDNPAFAAANKGGEFAPKANQAIALTFKAPAPGASAIGKLQISGGGSTWVYYLKGV